MNDVTFVAHELLWSTDLNKYIEPGEKFTIPYRNDLKKLVDAGKMTPIKAKEKSSGANSTSSDGHNESGRSSDSGVG